MGFGFTAIILWEDEYGLHDWKAFDSWEDAKPFLKGILESGVDPAKIMFAPMSVRWMFPQYHNGRDSVWIKNLVGDDAIVTWLNTGSLRMELYRIRNVSLLPEHSPDGLSPKKYIKSLLLPAIYFISGTKR